MTEDQPTPIGFVGTGAMGSAMVQRLMEAGHHVLINNRTRSHAQASLDLGAEWADTPAELAGRCDVVLGCLRDTAAVEAVHLGPGGTLAVARPGQVFVEHATFAPASARALAATAADRGAHFLDVPVTGGPDGARHGRLVGMAGGDAAALRSVAPVLGAYLASIEHMGGHGRGLDLKLVNQLLVTTHMAVAAEAASLLEALDLPDPASATVLGGGWAQSAMLTRTINVLRTGALLDTGVTIEGMREVQVLIADVAETAGVAASVFDASRARFDVASARGLGESDPASLVETLRYESEGAIS